jgi:asparagine synthase (glutamine-hydrolysing)
MLYKKFGFNCINFIIGDFVFVIYDKLKNIIFCARDHLGVKPFYYYLDKNMFAFASEKKGILSLQRVNKEINELFIYQVMANIEPELSQTCHKNIFSLLPGHQIIIENGAPAISPYWHLTLPPLLKYKKVDEYIEAFRFEMSRAVECRLRTAFPVSVELSGGLDSSGIAGFASRLIQDKNVLFSFSNVLPVNEKGEKEYADEEKYIDEIIAFNQIQNVVKNRGSDWADFLEPHRIALFVNSGVESYNAFWQEPLRKKMADKGIRVTLSGFPGDEAITNSGSFYFHDLLLEGEFLEFLKVSVQKGQYLLPVRRMVSHLMPAKIKRKMHELSPGRFSRNSYLLDNELDIFLEKDFNKRNEFFPESYKDYIRHKVTRRHTTLRMQSETSYGIRHMIEPRYPMADIRFLNFFLSLPSKVIGHPNISRYMYRRSMEGIIPENVRWRNEKTGAPFIYFWSESQIYAEKFMEWAKNLKNNEALDILNKLNIPKLIKGYDREYSENYKDGKFVASHPFEIELIIQYFGTRL